MAITIVGYKVQAVAGFTSGTQSISLTDLTAPGGGTSQPAEGDFILVSYGVASASATDRSLTITDNGSANYSLIGSEQFQTDTRSTNKRTAFKRAGASADTNLLVGPTGNTAYAGEVEIVVLRGVHLSDTLVFDVAAVQNTAASTKFANPSSITPATAGTVIVSFATAAILANLTETFSSSDFDTFVTAGSPDTTGSAIGGIGIKAWTSGAFDAAAYTSGGANSTSNSYAVTTVAIAPYDPNWAVEVDFIDDVTATSSTALLVLDPASLSPAYAAGDILVILVIDEKNGTPNTPSGWTLIDAGQSTSPADAGWGIFAKKAEASESSVSLTNANGNWVAASASLLCFRNVGSLSGISSSHNGGNTSQSLAGFLQGDLAMQGVFVTNEPTASPSRPAGWTDLTSISKSDGVSGDSVLGAFYEVQTVAGTVAGHTMVAFNSQFYRSFSVRIPAYRPLSPPAIQAIPNPAIRPLLMR